MLLKKIFTLTALLLTFALASCASLPEPEKENDCLVYGKVKVHVYSYYHKADIDPVKIRNSKPELRFRNIKTNKFLILRPNKNYDFCMSRIPQGTYIFHSYKDKLYFMDGKCMTAVIRFDKNKTTNFHFIPVDDTVINLGIMEFTYSLEESGVQEWHAEWDINQQDAYNAFVSNHPNSKWLEKEWITRHESLERNLTLFP